MRRHMLYTLGGILWAALLLPVPGHTQQPTPPTRPSGSASEAQFNNGGTFGGSTGLTLDAASVTSRIDAVTPSATSINPLGTHNTIACDASGAARTYTLPAATSGLVGRRYRVIKVDSTANACTIQPATGERINGTVGGTQVLTLQNSEVDLTLVSSTTPNWQGNQAVPVSSALLRKYVTLECIAEGTALTTGDGKCYFNIHEDLAGWQIVGVKAALGTVASAGGNGAVNVDVDVCGVVATGSKCSGTNRDVLTTNLTIDQNEDSSATAATAAVINTSNATLAADEWVRWNVDATNTGAAGLYVTIVLQKP